MTATKQAEALRWAQFYEKFNDGASVATAAELRRLHAENEQLRAELVAEAARTAEAKLRANQMTDQHRMQCNMRRELEAQAQPAREPLIARQLGEWHEDDGFVSWWAWCGHGWAGEPAWIGTPNDSDWPGYHTHWTPHPEIPAAQGITKEKP